MSRVCATASATRSVFFVLVLVLSCSVTRADAASGGGDPVAPGMEEDSDTTGLAVKNKDEDGGHLYHEMRQYSRGDGAQAPQYEMVPLASSLADLETGGT